MYNPTDHADNDPAQPYAIQGRILVSTDLDVYVQARWYDPGSGRFLSVDPLIRSTGTPQSANPYSYTENNPVNGVDPTGIILYENSNWQSSSSDSARYGLAASDGACIPLCLGGGGWGGGDSSDADGDASSDGTGGDDADEDGGEEGSDGSGDSSKGLLTGDGSIADGPPPKGSTIVRSLAGSPGNGNADISHLNAEQAARDLYEADPAWGRGEFGISTRQNRQTGLYHTQISWGEGPRVVQSTGPNDATWGPLKLFSHSHPAGSTLNLSGPDAAILKARGALRVFSIKSYLVRTRALGDARHVDYWDGR